VLRSVSAVVAVAPLRNAAEAESGAISAAGAGFVVAPTKRGGPALPHSSMARTPA
jgi:hypothetical protein